MYICFMRPDVVDSVSKIVATKDKDPRHLGHHALTNVVAANEWFRDKSSPIKIFDEFIGPYKLNVVQMALNLSTDRYSINNEVPCMLIATIGWEDKKGQWPVDVAKTEVFNKYRQAIELDCGTTYAADVVAIAQSNNVSVREVVDITNQIKTNEKFVNAKGKMWSTATTLASIHFATGLSVDQAVDKLLEIHDKTGHKESETTLCALTQASLLGDQDAVLKRFGELKEKVLHKEKWPKKGDRVGLGSKAFMVLAEVIGNFSPDESEKAVQTLIENHGLKQDAAVRYVLALANQQAETPVLCREGSFEEGEYTSINMVSISPTISVIPIVTSVPDTFYYSAAIRLGNKAKT